MATLVREQHETSHRDDAPVVVLTARLTPPRLPEWYVDRPRLSETIERGARGAVTLVRAPAGSGKTCAAAAWTASHQHAGASGTVCWVRFENGDDRPNIMWHLVIGSLRDAGVRVPLEVRPGVAGAVSRRGLALTGRALAEHDQPVVLVLDDYHLAESRVDDGLSYLLGHSGANLRMVILTRSEPRLSLARLRLTDDLCEVGAGDLALTRDESALLLGKAGIHPSAEGLETLHAGSWGWCAGVRLAALSARESRDPKASVGALRGESGVVGEYLRADFLNALPRPDRDLLLCAGAADDLPPGLLEHLAGRGAGRRMSALVLGNALVDELEPGSGHFRIHPWLRDLLRDELSYTAPRRQRALADKAQRWLAQRRPRQGIGVPGAGPVLQAVPDPRRRGDDREHAPSDSLAAVAKAPEHVPPWHDSLLVEHLTAKELEVLGHLAEFLATDEIATTMFVSVNTVRTHIRNILRKLGVNRRNEAVRRARRAGLLVRSA